MALGSSFCSSIAIPVMYMAIIQPIRRMQPIAITTAGRTFFLRLGEASNVIIFPLFKGSCARTAAANAPRSRRGNRPQYDPRKSRLGGEKGFPQAVSGEK